MRSLRTLLPLLVLAALLSGCASTGVFPSAHLTQVQLGEEAYEIVATDVRGDATAGYILGFSGSYLNSMSTLALARVSGDGMLYTRAIEDLWDNFREQYGEVEGRELALVNVRFDSEALNLILYTEPTVVVRADVVEFIR